MEKETQQKPQARILTEAEQKAALEYLNKRDKIGTCAWCQEKNWLLLDNLVEVRPFCSGNFVIGGGVGVTPLMMVMCQNCKQILFFSPLAAGIIERNQVEGESNGS